MDKNQIVEKIFQTLQRQKFADWYNTGNFDKWICGDLHAPASDDLKIEIAKLFSLDN